MSMRVIRGFHNLVRARRDAAVTLGNFDGVHLGHQALLASLREQAEGRPLTVVCFEPQPLELLRPEQAPSRLQRLSEKLRCLREQGVDQVVVLPFRPTLAAMAPEDFIRALLVDGLGAGLVLVGDDYRFGHRRQGDVACLRRAGKDFGFAVAQFDTYRTGDARVSSTRIRQALADGEIDLARRCLGRPYRLVGRVGHGRKLGREIGSPTANLALRYPGVLRHGVYCVRLDGRPAVANIGIRPTVDQERIERLEVHVLDATLDLYDRRVTVDFLHFLRPEQKFSGLDALKAAIAADQQRARDWFEDHH